MNRTDLQDKSRAAPDLYREDRATKKQLMAFRLFAGELPGELFETRNTTGMVD